MRLWLSFVVVRLLKCRLCWVDCGVWFLLWGCSCLGIWCSGVVSCGGFLSCVSLLYCVWVMMWLYFLRCLLKIMVCCCGCGECV